MSANSTTRAGWLRLTVGGLAGACRHSVASTGCRPALVSVSCGGAFFGCLLDWPWSEYSEKLLSVDTFRIYPTGPATPNQADPTVSK